MEDFLIVLVIFACLFGIVFVIASSRNRERMAMIEKGVYLATAVSPVLEIEVAYAEKTYPPASFAKWKVVREALLGEDPDPRPERWPKAARQVAVVDAEGQVLGRLATEAARILRGKHKPTYTPFLDCGDHVIVVNAEKVILTGRKLAMFIEFVDGTSLDYGRFLHAKVLRNRGFTDQTKQALLDVIESTLPRSALAGPG